MFTEFERQIFPYFDGTQQVWGDPLALNRELWHLAAGDLGGLLKKIRDPETPEPISHEATLTFLAIAREAFQMPQWDRLAKTGALEANVFATYEQFALFLDQKKSGAATSLTSPPASACREDSIMDASWRSGSTSPEQ